MGQRCTGSEGQPTVWSVALCRVVPIPLRTRIGALIVAVSLVSAAFAMSAPAANAAHSARAALPGTDLRRRVGHGLPGDPAALDAFTEATGVSPSVAMYFSDFGGRVDTAALRGSATPVGCQ